MQKSLRDQLDPSQVNCLNEAHEHPLKSILSKDAPVDSAFLESDADEQLLLNVFVSSGSERLSLTYAVPVSSTRKFAYGAW